MIAQEGQNVFDACLQEYGDLELLFDLIQNNDLTVNTDLGAGQEIIIDDTIGNQVEKEYVLVNNLILNNRTYETDITIEETAGIQWEISVDPAEAIYPYKLIVP